ncbi:preprotein translocase subunit SecE [Neisseria sp. N95_16]|uniref:Protein translocase subunit SecE n=1 Tax=Neisseria brasiliensis TaxID=2666100 RepID=A0A5Q3S990_9NEIS|nr:MULTISPECIES: preprotein translocase subunit SecE [Neisseria]MRN38185.1 preprotein translocase subunit SecE [Neisseria brasiliensis]PJO08978.1 preprotein translocase subunit SecE [Neisseria sp. N95_16]PJO77389.1 preprotein translocase subunit SecE [Neisseria sp. N177_16]QGL26456.1 preprotein translocase subunit SecE [Neisseria brasiliensis]
MADRMPEDKADKVGQVVKSDNNAHATPQREGFAYFRNSWIEFKKVVWPARDDAVKMTVFVVIFVAILAAFIYAVDTAVSWLFFDLLLKRG